MKEPDTTPSKPVFPEVITWESVAEYKALCREWDAARIKFKLATPEEVWRENSAVRRPFRARILQFGQHS